MKNDEQEQLQMMKTTGMVALMGEILCDNKKYKNKWKKRMMKAGLPDIQFPEDWDTLSEDEKEKRLNKIIEIARGQS